MVYLVGPLGSPAVHGPKVIEKVIILRLHRRAALRVELRVSAVGIHPLRHYYIIARFNKIVKGDSHFRRG